MRSEAPPGRHRPRPCILYPESCIGRRKPPTAPPAARPSPPARPACRLRL